jgi:hypothetical protein
MPEFSALCLLYRVRSCFIPEKLIGMIFLSIRYQRQVGTNSQCPKGGAITDNPFNKGGESDEKAHFMFPALVLALLVSTHPAPVMPSRITILSPGDHSFFPIAFTGTDGRNPAVLSRSGPTPPSTPCRPASSERHDSPVGRGSAPIALFLFLPAR